MSFGERVTTWNRWYDTMPSEWRFQFVLWSLLALGTLNMLLTVATGFPFALLVLFGIIVIAAIRVPYTFGWAADPTGVDTNSSFRIEGAGWLIDLNHRYEALPESRRLWVYPAVLLIAGAINMMLTIRLGFPFGLLFLIALLALVVLRAPYTAGWLQPAAPTAVPANPPTALPTANPPTALPTANPPTALPTANPPTALPANPSASEQVLPPAIDGTDPSPRHEP